MGPVLLMVPIPPTVIVRIHCKAGFSNFRMRQNHPGIYLMKIDCWDSILRDSDSVGLGWGLRIDVSNQFSGDPDSVVPDHTEHSACLAHGEHQRM